jgi:hypothetical protein
MKADVATNFLSLRKHARRETNLIGRKTDSKTVNDVRSQILTRKETLGVEARRVKISWAALRENSANLRAQAQGQTMKAIAVRKRLRQVQHDATNRDDDLGSEF